MSANRTGQRSLRSATGGKRGTSPIEAERVANAPCITRPECAALLHVSVRTVDRMIAAGEINVHRVRGKSVRFLRADVESYLQGKS